MRMVVGGLAIGSLMIAYKAGIYINAYYKLKKEKHQKVVNLSSYAEYKKRLKIK